MLKTICYVSSCSITESIDSIKSIYNKAKANNLKHHISGILIFHKGNFLQILEGRAEQVDTTFNKIKNDTRHSNIIKVINTNIEERIFEDYNFGFTVVKTSTEFKELNEYLNWLKNADHQLANKLITMVENFIKTVG
ncbi:BLUF domain-containing protein [Hyunsoonleella ulvae]|uniref:BLUF domain-containing protein n=1 Tax=Hyunsoonleella ulvae TaxID=2799948 RepID=UPI00193A52C2|nr:BLUF domain-containing protein [Hyunsoonleella ulvae]